ncbi:DUF6350 family protein [Nocardia sp. CNY236]|uniref:cell division protein PerM n=1 Tax=Nocardia sp. CNY236 TaxID=1169152 RepID=UPI00040DC7EB|nr:DUF6350 family protein [Nocardia sp. CNY236]
MNFPRNSLVRQTASQVPPPRRRPGESEFSTLTPERARVLLAVAGRPAAFGLTVIVVAVCIALLSAGSDLADAAAVVCASWLSAHHVPLTIGETSLGLLPLLPAALLVWLTGRECARAVPPRCTRADLWWIVGAAVGGPLLVTSVCLAVVEDAAGVGTVRPPNPLVAFAWVAALYSLAAVGGIVTRMRGRVLARLRLSGWAVSGIDGARRSVLRLLAGAALVAAVAFLANLSHLGETYEFAGNGVGVISLTLLSLVYLPNLVVLGAGILVGSSAQVGSASFGLFSVVGGPMPAFPLLVAAPTGPAAQWWVALLVIPAAVGVVGGLDCARTSIDRITAPWATLTSAAVATFASTAIAWAAGGALGAYGQVGVALPRFALFTFAWLAVFGWLGLAFARRFIDPVGSSPGDRTSFDSSDPYDESDRYDEFSGDGYHLDSGSSGRRDHLAPEFDLELDAELIDERPAIETETRGRNHGAQDIIDAEIVEADLEDGRWKDGR